MASGDYVVGRDIDFHISGSDSRLASESGMSDSGSVKKKTKKRSKKKKSAATGESDLSFRDSTSADELDNYDGSKLLTNLTDAHGSMIESPDTPAQMYRLRNVQEAQGKKSSKKKSVSFSKKDITSFKQNSAEERARLLKFWRGFSAEERRSLARIDKEDILRCLTRKKPDCTCTACGRRQEAFEAQLDELFDMNEGFFEQFAKDMVECDDFFFGYSPRFTAERTKIGFRGRDLLALRYPIPQYFHDEGYEEHQAGLPEKHDSGDKHSHMNEIADSSFSHNPHSSEISVSKPNSDIASPLDAFRSLFMRDGMSNFDALKGDKFNRVWELSTSVELDDKTRSLLQSQILTGPITKNNVAAALEALEKAYAAASSRRTVNVPALPTGANHVDQRSKANNTTEVVDIKDDPTDDVGKPPLDSDVTALTSFKAVSSPLSDEEIKSIVERIIRIFNHTGQSEDSIFQFFTASLEPSFLNSGISENDRYRVFSQLMETELIKKHSKVFNSIVLRLTDDLMENNGEEMISILEDIQKQTGTNANSQIETSPEEAAVATTKPSTRSKSAKDIEEFYDNMAKEVAQIPDVQQSDENRSSTENGSLRTQPQKYPMSSAPKTQPERDVKKYYDNMENNQDHEDNKNSKFGSVVNIAAPQGGYNSYNEMFMNQETEYDSNTQNTPQKSDALSTIAKECFTEEDSQQIIRRAFEQLNQSFDSAAVDPVDGTDDLSLKPDDNGLVANDKRRMFKASWRLHEFYGRLFEQRISRMYREHLAHEKQRLLLAELAEEEEKAQSEALRKSREKDKKKSKKLLAKQQREEEAQRKALEEKRKQEAAREKEAAHRAQQLEHDRAKQEAHRRKIEKRIAQLALGNTHSVSTPPSPSNTSLAPTRSEDTSSDLPKNSEYKEDNKSNDEKASPDQSRTETKKKDPAKVEKEKDRQKQERTKAEKIEKVEKERVKQEKSKQEKAKNEKNRTDATRTKSEKTTPKSKDVQSRPNTANGAGSTPTAVHAVPFKPSSAGVRSNFSPVHADLSNAAPLNSSNQPYRPPSQEGQWRTPEALSYAAPGNSVTSGLSPPGLSAGHIHGGLPAQNTIPRQGSVNPMSNGMPGAPNSFGNNQQPVSMEFGLSSNLGPRISTGMAPNMPVGFNTGFGTNFGPRMDSSANPNTAAGSVGVNATNVTASPSSSKVGMCMTGMPPPGSQAHKPMAPFSINSVTRGPNVASLGGNTTNSAGNPLASSSNMNRGPALGNGQFVGPFAMPQQSVSSFPLMSNLWSAPPMNSSTSNSNPGAVAWSRSPWKDDRKGENQSPPSISVGTVIASPWGSHSQRTSDADILEASRKGYDKVRHLGVDGLVPSQVLFHAAKDESNQKFTQEELYKACAKIPTFHCIRDDVGLITHIKM